MQMLWCECCCFFLVVNENTAATKDVYWPDSLLLQFVGGKISAELAVELIRNGVSVM